MTPVGESYRSPVGFDASKALAALILGLLAAILTAALIWLWEISPVPTLLIITSMIQGLILGGLMAFLIHRLKIHTRWLGFLLGLTSGLLSLVLVHLGHYLFFVFTVIPRDIAGEPTLKPQQKQVLLALYRAAPIRFADQLLIAETGHGGFPGYMMLRASSGEKLEHSTITGLALWGLWTFEGLFVVFIPASIARIKAAQPFCEDCFAWCESNTGLPSFPADHAETLAEAVRTDSPAGVLELRKHRLLVAGNDATSLVLHKCPFCDQSFLDLSRTVGSGNQVKSVRLLRLVRISPELVAVLRRPARDAEPAEAASETGVVRRLIRIREIRQKRLNSYAGFAGSKSRSDSGASSSRSS